jgi:hypothetical protein
MMSMNCSPPRATADSRPAALPAANALILDAVGERDEHRHQSDGERDVAEPVGRAVPPRWAYVAELPVAEHRAVHPERDADPEHPAPAPLGEQAADDQAEERAGERGDLVDAERQAPLGDRKGVGEQSGGVRGEHRAADALDDPQHDELDGPDRPRAGHQRTADGAEGEDEEAEVEQPRPAEHVAEPTEGHHQHGGDQQVAQ